MSLFNNDEGETIIEYPNGRTATLAHADATEPQFAQHDTEPQLQPWAETLEVLPDPFPEKPPVFMTIEIDEIAEMPSPHRLESGREYSWVELKGAKNLNVSAIKALSLADSDLGPYAAELEHLRANRKIQHTVGEWRPDIKGKDYNWSSLTVNLPPTSLEALANKFDASPQATTDATHAAHDALLAIVRLRAACEQMIDSETPINAEECLAFVEFAKQRLNVVATAAPLLKAGK